MDARMTCLEVEALATEYAEGVLPRPERRLVEEHLAACDACRANIEDMREALVLCREAEGLVVPEGLVQRILKETTGKVPWTQRFRLWVRPVLEPRLAMGLVMALISFSMVVRAAGVDVTRMSISDFTPSRVYTLLDRHAHLAAAKVGKYYRDLRVVYEIQTQLQAIRDTAGSPQPKPEPPRQQQPQPRPPQQNNKWSQQTVYMAAINL